MIFRFVVLKQEIVTNIDTRIEKSTLDTQGEQSRKDKGGSGRLVTTIRADTSPKTRCQEG